MLLKQGPVGSCRQHARTSKGSVHGMIGELAMRRGVRTMGWWSTGSCLECRNISLNAPVELKGVGERGGERIGVGA